MAKKIGEKEIWYLWANTIDDRRQEPFSREIVHNVIFEGTKEECEKALEEYKVKHADFIFAASVKLGITKLKQNERPILKGE